MERRQVAEKGWGRGADLQVGIILGILVGRRAARAAERIRSGAWHGGGEGRVWLGGWIAGEKLVECRAPSPVRSELVDSEELCGAPTSEPG